MFEVLWSNCSIGTLLLLRSENSVLSRLVWTEKLPGCQSLQLYHDSSAKDALVMKTPRI